MEEIIRITTNETEDKETAEEIIRANIDRANEILDIMQDKIYNSDKVSAMMLQSLAKMIDSVTSAANALISAETDAWGLQIRESAIKLKEREFNLKQLLVNPGARPPGTNVFVGSFSELIGQLNQPQIGEEDDGQ